jgi:hypothetical protein
MDKYWVHIFHPDYSVNKAWVDNNTSKELILAGKTVVRVGNGQEGILMDNAEKTILWRDLEETKYETK